MGAGAELLIRKIEKEAGVRNSRVRPELVVRLSTAHLRQLAPRMFEGVRLMVLCERELFPLSPWDSS